MKNTFMAAAVYVGLVIGAGFASGREVMQYFNLPSNTNICGILLASFLFIAISYIILSKSAENRFADYDEYIASVAGKLSPFVTKFMAVYMFCGLFVMFAGSGALLYSVSCLPKIAGAAAMSLICFAVLSFDLKGIVALNSVLVPLMVIGIIYVSVCSAIFKTDMTAAFSDGTRAVTLSAMCYVAYNTITAGAVLVPLARDMEIRQIRAASVGGGFVIGLLIMLVWTVQGINFDAVWDNELPMLTIAALCGKSCKRIYTLVLFMAICTTAVSYGFGLMSHFKDKIRTVPQRVLFAAVISLAALPPALYGFSGLVEHLYSFFGYVGMAWMLWIIIDRYSK